MLTSDRVRGPPLANVDLLECYICHHLLWKPVACQTCETPSCSVCINRWLADNPSKCPNQCERYTERKCPPFIAKLLAQLQISCSYQEKGCQEIIPYEALEKHEIECGYQSQQCPGCESQILKKNFDNHKSRCALIELTCQECKLVYTRGDADNKHTENNCLKEQLRQVKDESKQNKLQIQNLIDRLNKICALNPVLTKVSITFDDLPNVAEKLKWIPDTYKGFNWTRIAYMERSYAIKTYPESGYATSFIPNGSPYIAFFRQESSISIAEPNETIALVSLTAYAAWEDDLQLTITGYRNSKQVDIHTTTLLFGKPQVIVLLWKNIDKIIFKSSGGTVHPGTNVLPEFYVILAQLTIEQFF